MKKIKKKPLSTAMIKVLHHERYNNGICRPNYSITETERALERRGLLSFTPDRALENVFRITITDEGERARVANPPIKPVEAVCGPLEPPTGVVEFPGVSVCQKPKRALPGATKAQRARLARIKSFIANSPDSLSKYGGISERIRVISRRHLIPLYRKELINCWLNHETLELEYNLTLLGALVAES